MHKNNIFARCAKHSHEPYRAKSLFSKGFQTFDIWAGTSQIIIIQNGDKMGINISASTLSSFLQTSGTGIGTGGGKVSFGRDAEKKEKQKEQEPKTEIQQLIDDFKANEASPAEKKVKEIFNKFKAGKKLTAAELSYLAKNNPELYKKVREIIQEREAMERKMQMAETKLETAQASVDAMTQAKEVAAKSAASEDPEITMARSNQLASAKMEYMATLEYKQKPDTRSQTEDQIRALKEQEASQGQEAGEKQNIGENQGTSGEPKGDAAQDSAGPEDAEAQEEFQGMKDTESRKKKVRQPVSEGRGVVVDRKV